MYLDDLSDRIENLINEEYKYNPQLALVSKETILNMIMGRLYNRMICENRNTENSITKIVDYIDYIFNESKSIRELFTINLTQYESVVKQAIYFIVYPEFFPYQIYQSFKILIDHTVDGLVVQRDPALDKYDSVFDITELYITNSVYHHMTEKIQQLISFFYYEARQYGSTTELYNRCIAQARDCENMRLYLKSYKVKS